MGLAEDKRDPQTVAQLVMSTNFAAKLADDLKSHGITTPDEERLYLTYLYHAGRIKEAIAYYPEMSQAAINKQVTIIFCRCLLKQQAASEALKLLNKIDDINRPDPMIDRLKIEALVRLRHWEDANRLLSPLLRVSPRDIKLRYFAALIQIAKGNTQKAIRHCQYGLAYAESDHPLALRFARLLYLLKQRTPAPAPQPATPGPSGNRALKK